MSLSPSSGAETPRVLLLFEEHWTGVLLRAELMERGHDVASLPRLGAALVASSPVSLDAPLIVVAEQMLPSTRDDLALAWLRELDVLRSTILITGASAEAPSDAWDHVLRRPVLLGEIAILVDQLSHAKPPRSGIPRRSAGIPGFDLRTGCPWPMVRCERCSGSRHGETPRTPAALGEVRLALLTFGLAHGGAHGRWADASPSQRSPTRHQAEKPRGA